MSFALEPDDESASLVGLLDSLLDQGVHVAGDLVIGLADVDLIRASLRLLVASEETASRTGREMPPPSAEPRATGPPSGDEPRDSGRRPDTRAPRRPATARPRPADARPSPTATVGWRNAWPRFVRSSA